ncbi:cupin domain-containing protein [Nonomuraea monospora]|uniref:Cupin domain-containing protein n=1 Tax=Nonomuraea monospora TaxID=568818 RepID=A0ABN3C5H4_9ACTN
MSEQARVRKVAARDVPPNRRRGGDIRVVLGPRTAGASTGFMGVLTLRPGEYVSEHYHPYSEEFLYVVSGAVVVRAEDEFVVLEAGEGVVVPIGMRHRVTGTGAAGASVVFHLCPLAPSPELGHVDTEQPPNPEETGPVVGGPG